MPSTRPTRRRAESRYTVSEENVEGVEPEGSATEAPAAGTGQGRQAAEDAPAQK